MRRKSPTRECPACGIHFVAYGGRQVCVQCRIAEHRSPAFKVKISAWSSATKAIREGRLMRAPCEVCGAAKSDAHHDDYAKPLAVRWLCRSCHKKHHAEFGPGLNAYA